MASSAEAQTSVRCDLAPSTALGGAIAVANPGAILAISGICTQQVAIASVLQWGLTLTNHTGDPLQPLNANDGIAGQIQIVGPLHVTISGLSLQGPASDLGRPSVVLVQGGTVGIRNAQIVNGWRNGLVVDAKGSATVVGTTISGNGRAGIAGEANGIRVTQGSTLALGDMGDDGSIALGDTVDVTDNPGNGIAAFGASAVTIVGGTIEGNGGSQIFIADGSQARLVGTGVTQTAASTLPDNFAIQAMQSARIMLMQGASVAGGAAAGGVLAMSSSSLTIMGSNVANAASVPTIEASGSSNVLLSGGNIIANGAAGGTVVEIDHSSSLMQIAAAPLSPEFAGVPAVAASAVDTITGVGLVQEQSSMDLGVGLVGGLPGLAWNGSIAVAQNSSFRLSGGVSISGSVTLGQGSNGFFNLIKGGGNGVTGGVSCPWSLVPSSHVSAGALSPPASIAHDLQSATKNQCLPF
jgi:hypothetical protein